MTQIAGSFVIPAVKVPTIPVQGDERHFPVRRIWCVGRNYEDHAREMGGNPDREPPFFFAKPADAVVPGGGELKYPRATANLHYEAELAVVISGYGSGLTAEDARDIIFGYAVALDMTRRDLQDNAKRTARPWDMAKGFDHSCPIGPIRPVAETGYLKSGCLRLELNGRICQQTDISAMIWSIEECLSALSRLVEVQPGDVLLTGTPAGVGPVMPGDVLRATCENVGELELRYLD